MFQYFKDKNGAYLTSAAGFTNAAVNDTFTKDSGETYVKTSANTFNKLAGTKIPATTGLYDIGSSAVQWRDCFLSRSLTANSITSTNHFVNADVANNNLSISQYFDTNSSAYRSFGWDNTNNEFVSEDNNAVMQTVLNTGNTNFGNIMDPLVNIPFKRANDEVALSGVQTFTRASTATYIDPLDGLLKTAAIDTPRFEKMADGGTGILLEGTSTNLLTYTQDMSNPTAWFDATALGITAAPGFAAPDGSNNAAELTIPAGANIWRQNVPNSSGTFTCSVWVRLVSGSLTSTTLDHSDGTVATTTPLTTNWQRITGTVTAGAGTSTTGWFDITFWQATAGTKIQLWGAQVEALPFASSYIPTTTAAVTRAADILDLPISGNMTSMQNVSVIVDCDFYTINGLQYNGIMDSGTLTVLNRFVLHTLTDGTFQNYAGTSLYGGSLVPNQTTRIAVSNGVNKNSYQDGSTVATLVNTSQSIITNKITIGRFTDNTFPMYGHIRNFRIYDKALTAVEISVA